VFYPGHLRLWDGRPLVAGGTLNESPLTYSANVQIEDEDSWQTVASLSSPRADAVLTQWDDETAMVIGGAYEGEFAVPTTEWIDMRAFECRPGPTMRYARRASTAVAAPTGGVSAQMTIVAVSGQTDQTKLTPTVELLEPATNSVQEEPESFDEFQLHVLASAGRGMATVTYTMSEAGTVDMEVFSVDGRVVMRPLKSQQQEVGEHSIVIDLRDLSIGWHSIRLLVNGRVGRARVVVVR
jgi:hypothetical protein